MTSTLTIGLTGGIASGKSTVQTAFTDLGVPVLDADHVARDVVAPGAPALAQIAAIFGADMLCADGTLDRRRMREHVFGNPSELKRLEAITHPYIRRQIRAWKALQPPPYCIISVAILIESGMNELVDRVLVIDATEADQRTRLRGRDGIDDTLATRMLAAQLSRQQRLAAADDVLLNSGEIRSVHAAVAKLHAFYCELAQRQTPQAPGLRLPAAMI